MTAGIFPRVSYEEYAQWPGLRSSYLRHFRRTALHAWNESQAPASPGPALNLGNAIHTAILEPDLLPVRYARGIKVDRRFNTGKAEWAAFQAEHAGKEILEADDWETVTRVRDAVWRQPWAQKLFGGEGATELSARWTDRESGLPCKARIDRFSAEFRGAPTVVDLKSAADASKDAFKRSIETFAYGLQACFYLDGLTAISAHYRTWLWVVVEKAPPYAVALYEPDDEVLAEGRRLYRTALLSHLDAVRTGIWHGYPAEPQIIGRPGWARRTTEDAAL